MTVATQQRESLADLLAQCKQHGIRLWAEGDALRYSAPPGTVTPALLSEFRNHKQEILSFLLEAHAAVGRSLPPLTAADIGEDAPLSFAQERLWFLDRMGVSGAAYHIPLNLRFDGRLDADALRLSLAEIVRRHEPLRTIFREQAGVPRQRVLPAEPFHLSSDDLRGSADQAETLRALVKEENARPFDLTRDGPIRARLVRVSESEYALLLTLHHIAADGWSLGILLRELGSLYPAFAAGHGSTLPPLPIRYTDFAVWQRDWLSGAHLENEMAYWRQQLQGLVPLELPLDFPRPEIETFRGESFAFVIEPRLVRDLQTLSAAYGTTMFMTLLAAFYVLLHRYSAQVRISVGSPIANRVAGELEGLVGLFVNSLVLHTNLDGDPTFSELLARVRETALSAYAHQDVPFEKLVQELDPVRNTGRNPLFQVSFAVQQPEILTPKMESSEVAIALLGQGDMSVRFDLELHLWHRGDAFHGVCSWNADLFRTTTVERMMMHYRTLLADAVANPDLAISKLELTPSAERNDFSHGEFVVPFAGRSIASVISEQAHANPNGIAIECDGRELTYGELHHAALECAHSLHALGACAETRIAICLDRSPDLVIALLGILFAGATYIPLDPESPVDRLAMILSDCDARILITERRFGSELASDIAQCEVSSLLRGEYLENPANVEPDQLAYIIYTSGSTGRPKGAMITHGGLSNYLAWASKYYAAASGTGAPVHSSVAFDLTVTSLLVPLVSGKRVVLLPGGRDVELLSQSLASEPGFALVKLTPAHLEILNYTLAPERMNTAANALVIGGEALFGPQLAVWRNAAPHVRLINEYGPTETVVGCCVYDLPGEVPKGSVPIGRPIANTRIYILDSRLQPTPTGVPGEIYIGGAGLARGYSNDSAQTALRFIPDPFSNRGDRLYRTGDIGRWNADHQIEYLGRHDRQVKLRGFRVELDEVEAHLLGHSSVRDAAVMIREDAPGDKRLTAYIVPSGGSASDDRMEGRVAGWRTLFDDHIYKRIAEIPDPLFNTVGWVSTYDHRPIPEQELREWADDIVDTVLAARPRRVLEIGCGTGMLLFRIAPQCESYTGVDLSQVALGYVGEQIRLRPGQFENVVSKQSAAHEIDSFEPGSFDCIIVNSVIQYFPDVAYLLDVIEKMTRLSAPGGVLFFGDVRNYKLLRTYHASVQFEQADGDTPASVLKERIDKAVAHESELTVDPAFFPALRRTNDRIGAVEIRVERGAGLNELSRFRYHALLHLDLPERPAVQPVSLDLPAIQAALATQPECLCVASIPNLRLEPECLIESLLRGNETPTVAAIRQKLASARWSGLNPEIFYSLATKAGYSARVWWSGEDHLHCGVLFTKIGIAVVVAPVEQTAQERPWRAYANDPLQSGDQIAFIREVKTYLASRLPHYMVPSSFVTLEALPLTINGKVDHAALPAPIRKSKIESSAQPATDLARTVAGVFEDLLGVEVAVDDGFFDLGGHSLLLMQLAARLRELTGVTVPLTVLFAVATPSAIANWIGEHAAQSPAGPLPDAIIPLQPNGARRPLFLAPPASGTPMCYLSMIQPFDADQPVYGLQSPRALDGPWNIEALARYYVSAIQAVQPKGPYRIAGWSFGAPVAFEIAVQLRSLGEDVEILALMDAAVSDLSTVPRVFRPLLLPASLLFLVVLIAMTTIPRSYSDLRRIAQAIGISLPVSPRAFFRGFSSTFRMFSDTFWGMCRALRLTLLNTRAGLSYSPRIYDGNAVLFIASGNTFPHTARELAKFMPGGFDRRNTPGNHMSMMLDPVQAALLGRSLQDCLRRLAVSGER